MRAYMLTPCALWVAFPDRGRVVDLVKDYWAGRGARGLSGSPLALAPRSVQTTGKLAFAVAPAARVRDDGHDWIAVHDSEFFSADAELGRYLAGTLGVAVVHVEFSERLDWARARVYGQGGPKAPRGWDAVESFVEENLPYPVGPYPVGHGRVPEERLAEWEIFGFEAIAYRGGTQYRGPSAEEAALDVDKRLAEGLAARADIAGARALLARNPQARYHLLNALDRNMDDAAARGAYLAFADDILATDAFWMIDTLAKAVVLDGDEALFIRVSLGVRVG